MTHGEIRGTLVIAAIMLLAICGAAAYRSCGRGADSAVDPAGTTQTTADPGDGTVYNPSDSTLSRMEDSIILARKAAALTEKDSLRKADRKTRRKASGGKTSKQTGGKVGKRYSPTPSPLDRPVD